MNGINNTSFTDSDDELDNEELINERPWFQKMSLAIIAKWNSEFGHDETSSPGIQSHWLIMDIVDVRDFYRDHDEVQDNLEFYRRHINIDPKFVQLTLVEYNYLNGHEFIAISKLFWIKIIQRTWRKIFKERKAKINMRKMPKELQYRNVHGHWAPHLQFIPEFRSMIKIST